MRILALGSFFCASAAKMSVWLMRAWITSFHSVSERLTVAEGRDLLLSGNAHRRLRSFRLSDRCVSQRRGRRSRRPPEPLRSRKGLPDDRSDDRLPLDRLLPRGGQNQVQALRSVTASDTL